MKTYQEKIILGVDEVRGIGVGSWVRVRLSWEGIVSARLFSAKYCNPNFCCWGGFKFCWINGTQNLIPTESLSVLCAVVEHHRVSFTVMYCSELKRIIQSFAIKFTLAVHSLVGANLSKLLHSHDSYYTVIASYIWLLRDQLPLFAFSNSSYRFCLHIYAI